MKPHQNPTKLQQLFQKFSKIAALEREIALAEPEIGKVAENINDITKMQTDTIKERTRIEELLKAKVGNVPGSEWDALNTLISECPGNAVNYPASIIKFVIKKKKKKKKDRPLEQSQQRDALKTLGLAIFEKLQEAEHNSQEGSNKTQTGLLARTVIGSEHKRKPLRERDWRDLLSRAKDVRELQSKIEEQNCVLSVHKRCEQEVLATLQNLTSKMHASAQELFSALQGLSTEEYDAYKNKGKEIIEGLGSLTETGTFEKFCEGMLKLEQSKKPSPKRATNTKHFGTSGGNNEQPITETRIPHALQTRINQLKKLLPEKSGSQISKVGLATSAGACVTFAMLAASIGIAAYIATGKAPWVAQSSPSSQKILSSLRLWHQPFLEQ